MSPVTSSEVLSTTEPVGVILRRIVRRSADATTATLVRRLGVNPARLRNIINGHAPLSRDWITRYRLIEVLKEHYAEGWAVYGSDLEAAIALLPAHRGAPARFRADPSSFAAILWSIIGGHHTSAAKRLGIKNTTLSAILSGRAVVTQRMIEMKNWRRALAAISPQEWRTNKERFEQAVQSLPLRPGRARSPIEVPKTFGVILGQLLDAAVTKHGHAAKLLGLSRAHLSQIVNSSSPPSRRFVEAKGWPALLAAAYPEAWKMYGQDFIDAVAKLAATPGRPAGRGNDTRHPET